MKPIDALVEVFEEHGESLPSQVWAHESDRWIELLACLLNQANSGYMEKIRQSLVTLRRLNLTSVERLAAVTEDSEDYVVVKFVLKSQGLSEDDAARAVSIAVIAAQCSLHFYEGKIQRCLRKHSDAARVELMGVFETTKLSPAALRYALTHWLQNTTNAPLTLEDTGVLRFCREQNINTAQLEQIADDLDLNLAIVDDVLSLAVEGDKKEGGDR